MPRLFKRAVLQLGTSDHCIGADVAGLEGAFQPSTQEAVMKMHGYKQRFASTWRRVRGRHLRPLVISMVLLSIAGLALAEDDDRIEISGAIAEDVLIEQLERRGLVPPSDGDLTLEDYVYNNAGKARFNASVGVWLGPNGNMVPSPEWQSAHKDYCKQRARSPQEASQLLAFKMMRGREKADGIDRSQYWVYAQLINTDGDKIQKQHEGESSVRQSDNSRTSVRNNPDAEGLPPAMSAAWDGLDMKVGAPVSPCGDIRVTHVSGNTADEDIEFLAGWKGYTARELKYSWDFGDGSTAAGVGMKNPRHVYAKKGSYMVTVHVESGKDGTQVKPGSASVSVVIKEEEEDDQTGAIQPRDGTWAIKMTDLKTHGCSSAVASAVKSSMTKLMGENREEALTFAKPFHPKPLMKHDTSLVWERAGLNTWKTEIARRGSQAMTITSALRSEVVSPTRINEVGTTTFKMSGPLAKIISSSGNCRAVSNYELTWLH